MKIGIRADGGNEIGMGHVMRTIALGKELAKTNEVFYICKFNKSCRAKYEIGIKKIEEAGFNVKLIDESDVLTELKSIRADMLITDSYDLDNIYFKETKKIFRKTVYIDDLSLCYFDVDFIINQNIYAGDLKYKTNERTQLLLGAKYVMLREEFRITPEKYVNEKVKNIMVTVGGADANHVSEIILKFVEELEYNFHVIVGPAFKNIENLKVLERDNDKIKLYFHANMYKIMQKCDIAISACGSTLYELSACGVPTLGVVVSDNQERVAQKMNELGLIKNLGWYNSFSKEEFVKSLIDFCKDLKNRQSMLLKQRKIIDGNGVKRICNILNETCQYYR